MSARSRLIVVANRLPVHRVKRASGSGWETSPGGLVSALAPMLREREGAWVGWPGYAGEAPRPFEHERMSLIPVGLSRSDLDGFYLGFSNATLWPLYHDAVRYPEYHRRWWAPYVDVNNRFAKITARHVADGDLVWVQDYQLQLVPLMLRQRKPGVRIGFFLHIPFPPVELFAQLPWRQQLLEGLLGADVVGFQTKVGAQNFVRAARRFAGARGHEGLLEHRGRRIQVRHFPISIDYAAIDSAARRPEVAQAAAEIRKHTAGGRKLLLGVDRLDYTKGIDLRLRAFETLLERYENSNDVACFVQIAVPSREHSPEYADMRTRIEQLVGHINGTYSERGLTPVHYLYRNIPFDELLAYYLAADAMVVTPLRDGMNLVAKEYVATRFDNAGALVLSEFAGAAQELKQAIQVNPHDVDGIAAALDQALTMPQDEIERRMRSMRSRVRRHDVYAWASSFVEAMAS
ncbi:Trehalose-phosphate synthase [Planctomycetes bacterium Pla86]|uniref:Glucosylglycerol-phosphate synthase n=1 Tax=Engelhardtia mirabilis TaxID=2528011 RepID=A0A518BKX7_9BACT|nr:Trehalose-phosphate synthase [Planctomycetes bacterium Pla133]QDV01929.1 Trehalose-phosphate synthase [Planctomycetes bacterium Pla86]